MRRAGTRTTASRTIFGPIFDPPSVRSANRIGTSSTVNPALIARKTVSIWKA